MVGLGRELRHWAKWLAAGACVVWGCSRAGESPKGEASAHPVVSASLPSAAPVAIAPPATGATPTLRCPDGMALIPGGDAWIGADDEHRFSDDESPRFLTRLAPYCLDRTEVTAAAYDACVASGQCTPAGNKSPNCTGGRKGRKNHPINCVDFTQAETYCKTKGARLPSEAEWEFAARGGSADTRYPWGNEPPDGRACWKEPHTCEVARFAADSFGIFDLSGNVWEWTADRFGPYPWPPPQAPSRVYRGGSWSRRFEKWMHTRLRNRSAPWRSGSHLGFRCALNPAGAECPFGSHPDGLCRHGVVKRECSPGYAWNGVRCAEPGAPRCAPGRHEEPGFGCILDVIPAGSSRPDVRAEVRNVSRERSPEYDSDCQKTQRDRPRAFRYSGGTHDARNEVGRSHGCKNRDVGVGWNSACCP